jgi:hypothetical protein
VLEGIRAGGTRTGVTFRLIGTSVAAPQLARHVATTALGNPFPTASHVPTTPREKEGRGGGDIEPP